MRDIARGLRLGGCVLVLGITGAASLRGQDPREAQVARAFREFDPARRQQLLVSALNPTAGPLRGTWSMGVQLLAQTLIEDGKDSTAALWLRWAIRLSPDMQPDTVAFLPEVIAAHRSAKAFVTRTRDPANVVAITTWSWPASVVGEPAGRLEIVSSGSVPAIVEVRGASRIVPVGGASLSPGSYQLSAGAGSNRAQVTREVLPGVTTVLAFQLPTAAPEVVTKAPPPPQVATQAVPSQKKKHFPVLWVGLGAAGAVGLVALLANGGGEPSPETGGVIVTFPSP